MCVQLSPFHIITYPTFIETQKSNYKIKVPKTKQIKSHMLPSFTERKLIAVVAQVSRGRNGGSDYIPATLLLFVQEDKKWQIASRLLLLYPLEIQFSKRESWNDCLPSGHRRRTTFLGELLTGYDIVFVFVKMALAIRVWAQDDNERLTLTPLRQRNGQVVSNFVFIPL